MMAAPKRHKSYVGHEKSGGLVGRPERRVQQKIEQEGDPFLEWKYEFNEGTEKYEFKSIELSDRSKISIDSLKGALKRATGASDIVVGEMILNKIARGMTGERGDQRINEASALLPTLRPKDETEAMLLGQFLALQDSGMRCLRLANLTQCTAKSKRSKEQCQKWAVRGRMTRHMLGGTSMGQKTKVGRERSRLAALKHGGCTKESKSRHRKAMVLIRLSKDFFRSLSSGG